MFVNKKITKSEYRNLRLGKIHVASIPYKLGIFATHESIAPYLNTMAALSKIDWSKIIIGNRTEFFFVLPMHVI